MEPTRAAQQRKPVESSTIASVGYDPTHWVLEVEFRTGAVYQYFGVPPEIHHGLMTAASPGRFLNDQLKRPEIPYRKVRDAVTSQNPWTVPLERVEKQQAQGISRKPPSDNPWTRPLDG